MGNHPASLGGKAYQYSAQFDNGGDTRLEMLESLAITVRQDSQYCRLSAGTRLQPRSSAVISPCGIGLPVR